MSRFLPAAVIGAVAALLIAGAAWLAFDDGPYAAKVNGTEISQSSVDSEMKALIENEQLASLIAQSGGLPLASTPGATDAQVTAGRLGLRIAQELARQEVRRDDLRVTNQDRARGLELTRQDIGGDPVLDSLPEWFQSRLVRRWTYVAVLERNLLDDPSGALRDAAAAQCPSERYVSHILVATADEAADIQAAIAEGAEFGELARTRSQDPGSASVDGSLGCLDGLQDTVAPFLEVATNQPVGDVSDPVQTEFGFHLILVSDEPPSQDLAALSIDAVIRSVTNDQNVVIDPRYGQWDRANGQVLPPVAPTG